VTVFSEDGKVVEQFTQATGKRRFARPGGVAVGLDGSVYVTDSLGRRIVALTPDGVPSWVLPASLKEEDAVFGLPRGIGTASDGTIFVVDGFKFNLTQISREGTRLGSYGERGDAAGFFNYPNDVGVRDDLAVVADKENNRVQVLRLQGMVDPEATLTP
jgi:glucose/arabinose dehydrogenase